MLYFSNLSTSCHVRLKKWSGIWLCPTVQEGNKSKSLEYLRTLYLTSLTYFDFTIFWLSFSSHFFSLSSFILITCLCPSSSWPSWWGTLGSRWCRCHRRRPRWSCPAAPPLSGSVPATSSPKPQMLDSENFIFCLWTQSSFGASLLCRIVDFWEPFAQSKKHSVMLQKFEYKTFHMALNMQPPLWLHG